MPRILSEPDIWNTNQKYGIKLRTATNFHGSVRNVRLSLWQDAAEGATDHDFLQLFERLRLKPLRALLL